MQIISNKLQTTWGHSWVLRSAYVVWLVMSEYILYSLSLLYRTRQRDWVTKRQGHAGTGGSYVGTRGGCMAVVVYDETMLISSSILTTNCVNPATPGLFCTKSSQVSI